MFSVDYFNYRKNEWIPVRMPYKTYEAAMRAAAQCVRNGFNSFDVRVRELNSK